MSTITKTSREQFEELVPQIQALADEADAKGADFTAEDMGKLNEMLGTAKRLQDQIVAQGGAKGAQEFLVTLGADGARAEQPLDEVDGIVNPKGMTLGEAFTKSPAYADFHKRTVGPDGLVRKNAKATSDLFHVPGFGVDAKALVTGASSTSGGAFVVNDRLPGVTDLIGDRELYVRDLCTNITTQSDTFEYVRVTGKTNNAAAVPEATTSATPGLNNVAVGAYSSSHGVKPESALTLAVVTSPVETIAHLIPVTRRAAADSNQVRQLIDAFLLQGLKEEEEDQILNGDGNSPNLRGILQDPDISTVGSSGTDLDAVVDAIRTIRNDRRRPNAMVVHPNDWYSTGFLLAKDSAGNYLVGDPRASVDQLSVLWGLRVVVTEAMTENTLLVGDFTQAVVADRQQSTIYVSDSHNDWFARNILAVLAEERLGFGVLDPDAFCTVTGV